jgi:peptidoglycan/xylan/chitin deacetylase (PgdA/CDA1 family)
VTIRRILKQGAERALSSALLARFGSRPDRGGVLILAYHNVVEDPGTLRGDRSLHIGLELFRRHLDLIARRAVVRSLDDILDGTADGPTVAITFDDAYAGACALALPELRRRSLPATVFVAPGLIGAGSPWWDVIAGPGDGLDPDTRQYCLEELSGRHRAVLNRAGAVPAPAEHPECRIADWELLQDLREYERVTIGAHSWGHPNLRRVTSAELHDELVRPQRWLQDAFPEQQRPWLAYPYGLYSDEISAAARAAGYEVTFAIRGGWFRGAEPPPVLPRLNIPAGLSVSGLDARLNGFLT